ncbi:MAG: acyl-CoA dehydrogenase family protein [Gemmatimonadota bacterium]
MSRDYEETRPPLTLFTEDERMFRDAVREFALAEVAPRVQAMDEAESIDPDLVPQLFDLGLMGVEAPETSGGLESSFFTAILVVEELSRVDPSVAVLVDVQNTLVVNAILRWGSEEQKAELLPRLTRDVVGAYALSEAGSGSDAFALSCRAVQAGGDWILTGRKLWTTNGSEAGLYIVFATVDPDAGHRGITAFLVDREAPGFSVGKREKKLGIRASSTAELVLDGCRVPGSRVMGEVGKGYRVAIETLNEGRIGIGAQMVGLAQGAIDQTTRYVGQREQFGRPVSEFQAVRFQLADLATELQAARLLVYDAARRKDAGLEFAIPAAQAKLFASRAAQRVASECLDLHGGYGFTREYPIEKLYRDSKIGTIYEGTTNMQLQTIANHLLQDD